MSRNHSILNEIEPENFLSPELHKEAVNLNRRIEELVSTRAEHDRRANGAKEEDPVRMNPAELLMPNTQALYIECLQREVKIRRDLSVFGQRRREAYNAEATKQHAAAGQAEAALRKNLAALGYVDEPPIHGNPAAITPEMILRHPAVRALRAEAESLQAKAGDLAAHAGNLDAHDRAEKELIAIRDRMAVA